MSFRFPLNMMIRCYGCGKVFDVAIRDNNPYEYPCPACGKIETVDLGGWQRKAIAWSMKKSGRSGGRR